MKIGTLLPRRDWARFHRDLPIVGVDLLIKNPERNPEGEEEYLLLKRRKKPDRLKYWFSGSRLLKGESFLQAINRTAMEECGIHVNSPSLITVLNAKFDDDPFGHGKGTHTVTLVYLVTGEVDEIGSIQVDPNHMAYGWFTAKEIISGDVNTSDYVRSVLRLVHHEKMGLVE